MRCIQFRSAPAEKLLPAPPSTTTRTAGSAPSARRVVVSWAIRASSKALCRSGRLSMTVATPACVCVMRLESDIAMLPLHTEQAEAGFLDRRIEAGRYGQPQHATGVYRVYDAIVPQPRGGIVRVAL